MADGNPVHLSSGLPETILDPEPPEAVTALAEALAEPGSPLHDAPGPTDARRAAVAAVVATWPRDLDAWAQLGRLGRDDVEAYACFRVGYHRGLDRLRQSGWRGSGYVRWRHEPNRGFLRSLRGLQAAAAAIGEVEEERRCAEFVAQLDPEWDADPQA